MLRHLDGLRPGSGLARTVAVVGVVVIALSGCAFVTRASVSNTGEPANYATPSFSKPAISADGRYLAFDSFASNLLGSAPDGGVFVRDVRGAKTSAASIRANGTVDDAADSPAISGDGRFVAFVSDDASLVPGGNDNYYQVFLRDRTSGVTTRVSAKPNGLQASDESGAPSISADGRYIAFESDSPGLVAGDGNDWTDVFVRDRVTNTTKRVSLTSAGTEADIGGEAPSISGSGKVVAFISYDALVPSDTNDQPDVYVRDLTANTTTLASLATNGTHTNDASASPSISANGRYVAFSSLATNLDGIADTNAALDIFVRDLIGGTTQRVSLSSTGGLAHGEASEPSISADGRFVSYQSTAADSVGDDTNGVPDAFVYDRTMAETSRVSTNQAGEQLPTGGTQPVVSADGRMVAFATDAAISNQTPSTERQLYVRLVEPGTTDDPPSEVSVGNVAVVEGDARPRQVRFTVSLSRPSGETISVAYATAAGTAAAGSDFVAKSGTLTIPPGSTSGVVAVNVNGDRAVEEQETFSLKITNPQGGAVRRRVTGIGTIINDDSPSSSSVQVSVGNAAVVEGDMGTRALAFPVTLSARSASPVTVHYATAGGTATSGTDFTAKSGTVTIPALATAAVVSIKVRADLLLERTEAFTVRLLTSTGVTIYRATGTGSIIDDG